MFTFFNQFNEKH